MKPDITLTLPIPELVDMFTEEVDGWLDSRNMNLCGKTPRECMADPGWEMEVRHLIFRILYFVPS